MLWSDDELEILGQDFQAQYFLVGYVSRHNRINKFLVVKFRLKVVPCFLPKEDSEYEESLLFEIQLL